MKKILKKKYYDYQTELAINNFPFTASQVVHKEFVYAICELKEAAAKGHKAVGEISPGVADAIIQACKELKRGKFDDQFFLPGIQGGAGTSIHMNVNEVLASRSTEILAGAKKAAKVHPNDHVNRGQSTNDVLPSALKVAAIKLVQDLLKTLNNTSDVFERKGHEFKSVPKLARTHLQDAVPTTLGAEFFSYTAVIKRGRKRLEDALPYLYDLNLGGTAVGNSINASPAYIEALYGELKKATGFPLRPAANLMSQTSSQTDFLMLSQALCAITCDFSKIANDLRLLSSGPSGGIGEIRLKELQPGSSIMPGKVNPIMPETVNQLYFFVSGNTLTIEHAAQAAQLELGVMVPIIADRLITSLKIIREVLQAFADSCVKHIVADPKRCLELLEQSSAYATQLTPTLGYEEVSAMVKEANHAGDVFYETLKEKGIDVPKILPAKKPQI